MSLSISNIYHMKRFFAPIIIGVGQAYKKLFPNTLKKRTWWPVFGVGVLLIAAMGVGIAHGQAALVEGILNGIVDVIATILLELSKLCIFLTIFFLRAFITLASYNNFIDVSVVKLGWVMVRDVANMFFIVGLLVIAFATILGFESYEWKHGLVKIVLMAILINFSNLIAQLVIDIAHIFTITFLNAVSATAGGNLITMFQMDNILELAQSSPSELGATREVASLTLFAGAVLAFIFALLAALTIGAYMVVMIFRIVVLWALIVLSPLAFMMYAVPKGEEYAHEWWSEFSKHVIVAPIMVFFLWLAFATLGTGQIISEIQSDPNVIQLNSSGEKQSVTVLEISTWENFASFLLGIGFLWMGIKKTEETGATGAGLVGNAIDFTKNVATIATGYAAGRWLVGGAVDKVKSDFPVIGGKSLARKGMMIKGAYNAAKSKVGIKRDTQVQKWEKGYKEAKDKGDILGKLKYGALRFGLGSLLASDKKKDAVAGTWEELAHYVDEEHEARISNSGTLGGSKKDEQRIRTELAVRVKDTKGTEKGATGLLKLMDNEDKQVLEDLKNISDSSIRGHEFEELAQAREKKGYFDVKEDLNAKGHYHDFQELLDEKNQERIAANQQPLDAKEVKDLQKQFDKDEKARKYYGAKTELRELNVENEKHDEAFKKEGQKKDELERIRQSRDSQKYQAYDARAVKAGLEAESAKNRVDLQGKRQTAEVFRSLMSDQAFEAEQQEQARLSARVKSMEDEKNAQKEVLLLKQIRDLLERGGFDQALEAQVALEIAKGRSDTLREQRTLAEKDTQGRAGNFNELLEETAVLESQKERVENDKIMRMAEERAKFYESDEGGRDDARAQATRQQAVAQIMKKQQELNANLTFNQRRSKEQLADQKLKDLRQRQIRGALTQGDRVALDNALRQKRELVISNLMDGGATSQATRAQSARALGFDEVTSENVQEIELRRLLGLHKNARGRNGQLFSVSDLEGRLESSFSSPEEYQMFMTRYIAAQKTAATKGDVTGVAVATDKIMPDGKLENMWTPAQDMEATRSALVKYMAADMSADAGVLGIAEEKIVDQGGNEYVRKFGDEGRRALKGMLNGKTGRWFEQKNSYRLTEQMKDIKLSTDPAQRVQAQQSFDDYIETIRMMKESFNQDGFKASQKAWKEFYDQLTDFAQSTAQNDGGLNLEILERAMRLPPRENQQAQGGNPPAPGGNPPRARGGGLGGRVGRRR